MQKETTHFAICLNNEGYPASLKVGRLYRVIVDSQAEAHELMRVIDESGEDYAFSSDRFYLVDLPQNITEILLASPRFSREEMARRAKQLYENGIRQEVETEENIGKMVIIDVDTGDYEVDEIGLNASDKLHKKRPNAQLFRMRIGYNVAVSFVGGGMKRVYR